MISDGRGLEGEAISKLSAHYVGVAHVPVFIADRCPFVVEADLHAVVLGPGEADLSCRIYKVYRYKYSTIINFVHLCAVSKAQYDTFHCSTSHFLGYISN